MSRCGAANDNSSNCEPFDQITHAQTGDDFLLILNPYGEWLPTQKPGGMDAALRPPFAVTWRGGGNWLETGGYPFFAELCPGDRHYQYGITYPPAFADFLHLQSLRGDGGRVSRAAADLAALAGGPRS